MINSPDFDSDYNCIDKVFHMDQFKDLRPLSEHMLCTLATTAPVERIFLKSGIIKKSLNNINLIKYCVCL
jgi:hypothetical protein